MGPMDGVRKVSMRCVARYPQIGSRSSAFAVGMVRDVCGKKPALAAVDTDVNAVARSCGSESYVGVEDRSTDLQVQHISSLSHVRCYCN